MSKDEIKADHARFVQLAALGVNVFVSSGDAGSNPDASGQARSPDSQVEYPASDPAVVAVGGTSLDRDDSGNVVETCWKDSGGGVSTRGLDELTRPTWQSAYPTITSPYRLVPDVSSLADPVPGALIILKGRDDTTGGTSWSAPVWAGFSALLSEDRAKASKPPYGFLGPKLYAARGGGALRDVVKGDNGAYKCGPGWNPVAGLGVPDVKRLAKALP